MNVTSVIIMVVIAVAGLILWLAYRKGGKDAEHKILLKSAEDVAKASIKIADETRRTAHDIQKLGPDTSVADGNKLLSGGE